MQTWFASENKGLVNTKNRWIVRVQTAKHLPAIRMTFAKFLNPFILSKRHNGANQ